MQFLSVSLHGAETFKCWVPEHSEGNWLLPSNRKMTLFIAKLCIDYDLWLVYSIDATFWEGNYTYCLLCWAFSSISSYVFTQQTALNVLGVKAPSISVAPMCVAECDSSPSLSDNFTPTLWATRQLWLWLTWSHMYCAHLHSHTQTYIETQLLFCSQC